MAETRKSIVSRVEPSFYKELRKICAENEITINELVIRLLKKEFPILKEKNNKA